MTVNGDGPRPLLPQHRADLERSGLSEEMIRACGFYSANRPDEIQRLLHWDGPAARLGPCLVVPFHGPGGEPTDYCRVKPDRPRVSDGKAVKYESPKGQPNRAYFPPGLRDLLSDPSRPLLITEGEKKSAKAVQDGFACIGLTGVWSWQRGRNGDRGAPRELIPDLDAPGWSGRQVVIIFDSDASAKPDVREAERHLAAVLEARGAGVRVVRLPSGPGGAKAGLDVFLTVTDCGAACSCKQVCRGRGKEKGQESPLL